MSESAPAMADRGGAPPANRGHVPSSPRSLSTHPARRPRLERDELVELQTREAGITARLECALNAASARVALMSRAGCDLRRFRFDGEPPTYTHTGFAVRRDGAWYVHQMLNTGSGPEGHLYRQSLVDFFRDDPYDYRCGVLVPSPGLQDAIAAVLDSPLAGSLYTPRYNRLAYPFCTRYQNSNQWVAEIVAAAQGGGRSRTQVQAHLQRRGLVPSVLRAPGYVAQTAFALLKANTRFDDHPLSNRLRGRIAFVTEVSLRDYLQRVDGLILEQTVRLGPDPHREPPASSVPVVAQWSPGRSPS